MKRSNRAKNIDLEKSSPEKSDLYNASQWKLMWWNFKKHRLALVSVVVLAFIYILAAFCEFISPNDPNGHDVNFIYAPPQRIRFRTQERFSLRPVVFGYKVARDPVTLRRLYSPDPEKIYSIRLFARGDSYKFWGMWETDVHLFGVDEGEIFLLGTDRLGRDTLSRLIYGTRVSSSIGLIGVMSSFVLGVIIGGFAGYFGGLIDTLSQRLTEFLRSIPKIPLWMGLSAALPPHWSPVKLYLGITIILSLVGWTNLARVVRSKFLSLREEDFVKAAKICGARAPRIVFRHMLPSFMSYIIAAITLAIPGMIIGETSLSFLGLGMRAPSISWGVLLQEAQNVRTVALYPWLLAPGLLVIVTVLAFNFLGDGLRDAADPYGK